MANLVVWKRAFYIFFALSIILLVSLFVIVGRYTSIAGNDIVDCEHYATSGDIADENWNIAVMDTNRTRNTY